MIVYIASNNDHKIGEIKIALPFLDIKKPSSIGIDFAFDETGNTFIDNAVGKALALWQDIKAPVLADDSGLCVDALNGAPGVFSARYGSSDGKTCLSDKDRNDLLLSQMAGHSHRTCRFVCAAAFVVSPDRIFIAQETCEGTLLEKSQGVNGFGYDPLVFLPELGCSVAELSENKKNDVSHRGKALRALSEIILKVIV